MTEHVAWLVRAGERSRHATRFASGGVIAIGWPNIDGLRDLRGLSKDRMLDRLRSAPAVRTADADLGELLAFRDEIHVGDIVITPDAPNGDVLVGEVTGDYEYSDPSPAADYHHVRSVRWYGRWDRDLLPEHLRRETNYRRTLRRLTHHADWLTFAESMRDSSRAPTDARRQRRESPTSRPSNGIRERVCPQCGLRKATSQFRGDVCVDCE